MNDAFLEKDEKYGEWATRETRENKVGMAVMVCIIISHEEAVHNDTVKMWKDISPDNKVDWVRMAQSDLRFNDVVVGSSSTGGAGSPRPGGKRTPKNLRMNLKALQKDSPRRQSGEKAYILNLFLRAMWVCGLRTRHLPTVLG